MLALDQGGQPPARDAVVELDAVGLRHGIPEARPVDVHEIVGDQAAVPLERHGPVDVLGRIPLVDLGLLIESAQVGLLAAVVVKEMRGVLALDLMTVGHGVPPVLLSNTC